MAKKEIIRLEEVCKYYQMGETTVNALQKVSLSVNENDYIAILGPSGSGKSTLLHMMGLLDIPSCGRIYVDGVDVSEMPENNLARLRGKKIGFVFRCSTLSHRSPHRRMLRSP
jgi:putative ABC transport system ATP-binding protein